MLRWFHVEPQGGLPYTPPLDAANAAAAYSVRKLRTAYTGPCMAVRNLTTGTNTDIGFDSNGYLDIAALLSFAGSADVVVVTWYDQASGSHNLIQNTASVYPTIVESGALFLENGLAALKFINDFMTAQNSTSGEFNFLHNGDTSSHYVVLRAGNSANPADFQVIISTGGLPVAASGYVVRYRDASGVNNGIDIAVPRGSSPVAVFSSVQNVFTPNQQNIMFITVDADNATAADRVKARVNNDVQFGNNTNTAAPSLLNSTTALQIGNESAQDLAGSMQELVIYETDQASNETTIRDNANAYFSIY